MPPIPGRPHTNPSKLQSGMPKKAAQPVPAKVCKACDGTGVSSRGDECYPCGGTGKPKPVCPACEGTGREPGNYPCPACQGTGWRRLRG